MRYKAVLFDLAGTVLNTQNGFQDAEIDGFRQVGIDVTEDDLLAIHIEGPLEGLKRLYARLHPDQYGPLTEIRRRLAFEYLAERSVLYPDTTRALEEIKPRVSNKTGLVTSARLPHIESMNVGTKIRELLPVLASREDVGDRTKPDPYGLEIACGKLQVRPQDTLFVCDAAFDTMAARRAGMDSCFIERPEATHKEIEASLKHATFHVRSLMEVLNLPRLNLA